GLGIEFSLAVGPEFGMSPAARFDPFPGLCAHFIFRAFGRPLLGLLFGFPFRLFEFPGLQSQPLGPRLGPLLLALLLAGDAFAADRLEVGLEVIGAVIVIDFLARLDVLDRADENLSFARPDVALRVRPAGVIDVTGDVLADRTIDGPAIVELEQVFVFDRVVFFLFAIQQRPKIADDFGALLDPFGGEEAKSSAGAADAVGFLRRNRRHEDKITDNADGAMDREAGGSKTIPCKCQALR